VSENGSEFKIFYHRSLRISITQRIISRGIDNVAPKTRFLPREVLMEHVVDKAVFSEYFLNFLSFTFQYCFSSIKLPLENGQ
jgi:hypothetical protein